jgi:hypothetical protein
MAEEARARGDEERAELYESAAEALRPAWTELETLRNAWGTALTDLADARHRLWLIGLRRPTLMEECGIITEISDPMASFQRRVPRRTDPSPAPGGPYVSQPDNYDNQASGNKQPVAQLAAPIIPAKLVFPGFLKAINQQNSPEAAPTATTAETMQVEQPASAKKCKRILGYTHLSLGKKTDQFGANTARSRTLKISTPRRTMRVLPVRSIKK